ncbi:MAG: hypothetical protein AAF934_06290, partial [Bacteroidota bacterium]
MKKYSFLAYSLCIRVNRYYLKYIFAYTKYIAYCTIAILNPCLVHYNSRSLGRYAIAVSNQISHVNTASGHPDF